MSARPSTSPVSTLHASDLSARTRGRTSRTPDMGELKMEKKGDVELAKIIAEIDALKEEAAQVGRAPTPFWL